MRSSPNNMQARQGGVFAIRKRRIVGIDVMRVSLAILIYMFHSWMHFDCDYHILNDFVSVGAIAMTGFFMLSGYSLRMVYGEQNLLEKQSLMKFYIKRMLGVLPLYYIMALLYVLLFRTETLVDNILLFPIEVLGLQSTFSSLFSVSHNGGTWFVSCLLLGYLVYPFLQTIIKLLNTTQKGILLLLFIFLDIWSCVISHRFNTAWTYDNSFFRILEFTCGLIMADINYSNQNKWLKIIQSKWALLCSVMVLFVGVSVMRHYTMCNDYMAYNIIAIPCFGIMMLSFGRLRMPILERSRIIGYLGTVSYGFFLSQFFAWKVGKWTLYYSGHDINWLRILIPFMFCVIASIAMYELIQKPITKYVNLRIIKQ